MSDYGFVTSSMKMILFYCKMNYIIFKCLLRYFVVVQALSKIVESDIASTNLPKSSNEPRARNQQPSYSRLEKVVWGPGKSAFLVYNILRT